jgi:hypothetical protein
MKVQHDLGAVGTRPFSKEVSTTWSDTLARAMMIFVVFVLGFLPVQAQDKAPCLKNGSETSSPART